MVGRLKLLQLCAMRNADGSINQTWEHFQGEAEWHRRVSHSENTTNQEEFLQIVNKFVNKVCIDDVILDVGCGPGDVTEHLIGKCNFVVGVDYAINMLLEAKKRLPHIPFVCADAHNLPFKYGAFDVIVSNAMLQHVEKGKEGVIKELGRVGSKVILVTNQFEEDFVKTENYYCEYFSKERIEELFKEKYITRITPFVENHVMIEYVGF